MVSCVKTKKVHKICECSKRSPRWLGKPCHAFGGPLRPGPKDPRAPDVQRCTARRETHKTQKDIETERHCMSVEFKNTKLVTYKF